jgi:hypothetical protein
MFVIGVSQLGLVMNEGSRTDFPKMSEFILSCCELPLFTFCCHY